SGQPGSAGNLGGGGGGGGGGGNLLPSGDAVNIPKSDINYVQNDGWVELDFDEQPLAPQFILPTEKVEIPASSTTFGIRSVGANGIPSATYSLVDAPSWVSVDPNTGYFTASGYRPAASGAYTFYEVATNRLGTSTLTVTFTVDAPLYIAPTGSATATVGEPFSYTAHAASYPNAPTYSLGGAPTWLTIDHSTGEVTGTPPSGSQGTDHFYVFASNGVDPMLNQYVTLTVDPAPLYETDPSTLPDATVGTPYSYSLSATGGVAPYTWSMLNNSLPAGLSLDPSGAITGTPIDSDAGTTAGVAVHVADSAGNATSKVLTLNVKAAPAPTPTPAPTPSPSPSQTPTPTPSPTHTSQPTPSPTASAENVSVSLRHYGTMRPGGLVLYRVTVKNNGRQTVPAGTTVTITLPSTVTPRFVVGFGWHCEAHGHVMTCRLSAALRPHHPWSLGIVGTISSHATGTLTTTAKVEPSGQTATETDRLAAHR
ncbi:MAG TPA: putative Ig domain-containing protein, partial [Acidothermaceae bacterium]